MVFCASPEPSPFSKKVGPPQSEQGLTLPIDDDLFQVAVSADAGAVVVAVRGELDTYTAPRLREQLRDVIDQNGHQELALELSGMSFVDSSGLAVLVDALKRMRQRGGTMTLHAPTRSTTKVLEISGLDKIFDIRP